MIHGRVTGKAMSTGVLRAAVGPLLPSLLLGTLFWGQALAQPRTDASRPATAPSTPTLPPDHPPTHGDATGSTAPSQKVDGVRVTLHRLNRGTPSLGQSIPFRLEITAPPDHRATVPAEQPLGGLELLNTIAENVQQKNTQATTQRFRLELMAFEPGEFRVGPVHVDLLTDKGDLVTVDSNMVRLTIASPIGNEPNATARGEGKAVTVVQDDYTLAWVGGGILGALLLTALGFALARWWSRREKPAPPPPPPRPAWEVAHEQLAQLRSDAERPLSLDGWIAWTDQLSDTLRQYLGARYDFDGIESTSREVVQHLQRVRPHGVAVEEVTLMLDECDLVKFAKATPEQQRSLDLLEQVATLVHNTAPQHTKDMTAVGSEKS